MARVAALAAWLLLGTTYRIERGALILRQLYRRVDIPVTRITAVRPRTAASPRRGPMWHSYSLGTALIEIDDAGWTTLVSPRDETEFLAELTAARGRPPPRDAGPTARRRASAP